MSLYYSAYQPALASQLDLVDGADLLGLYANRDVMATAEEGLYFESALAEAAQEEQHRQQVAAYRAQIAMKQRMELRRQAKLHAQIELQRQAQLYAQAEIRRQAELRLQAELQRQFEAKRRQAERRQALLLQAQAQHIQDQQRAHQREKGHRIPVTRTADRRDACEPAQSLLGSPAFMTEFAPMRSCAGPCNGGIAPVISTYVVPERSYKKLECAPAEPELTAVKPEHPLLLAMKALLHPDRGNEAQKGNSPPIPTSQPSSDPKEVKLEDNMDPIARYIGSLLTQAQTLVPIGYETTPEHPETETRPKSAESVASEKVQQGVQKHCNGKAKSTSHSASACKTDALASADEPVDKSKPSQDPFTNFCEAILERITKDSESPIKPEVTETEVSKSAEAKKLATQKDQDQEDQDQEDQEDQDQKDPNVKDQDEEDPYAHLIRQLMARTLEKPGSPEGEEQECSAKPEAQPADQEHGTCETEPDAVVPLEDTKTGEAQTAPEPKPEEEVPVDTRAQSVAVTSPEAVEPPKASFRELHAVVGAPETPAITLDKKSQKEQEGVKPLFFHPFTAALKADSSGIDVNQIAVELNAAGHVQVSGLWSTKPKRRAHVRDATEDGEEIFEEDDLSETSSVSSRDSFELVSPPVTIQLPAGAEVSQLRAELSDSGFYLWL